MTALAGAGPWSILVALALLAPRPASAADGAYAQDEIVVVTGRVTDIQGRPVPGLRVVFEAARGKVSLRQMRSIEGHPTRLATTTGADGEYRFEWSWHDFYNRFAVELSLRDPTASEGGWRTLQKLDLSTRVPQGSPVVAHLAPGDDEGLERHRAFFASLATEDERRVFTEMGAPDQTDRLGVAGREEVTWWYFRAGTAYRFVDGVMDELSRFEPVEAF